MNKTNSGRASVFMLALGHGITDLYANFLASLLPFFESKFALSKTMIGIMISVIGVSGSMFQLVYGYLGDKWGRRLFLIPGPAIAGIFMSLIGLSPSFSLLITFLLIGGMGVSAFHPHAASAAGDAAKGKRDIGLAVFMAAGTVGYAVGPLAAVYLISSPLIGPARMPFAAIIGIVTSALLYKYAIPDDKHLKSGNSLKILDIIKPRLKILSLLCIIVVLRSTTNIVYVNFLSLLIKQRGLSLMIGGWVLLLFSLSTAFGTFIGGYISNRISRKSVLISSMLLAIPFLISLVFTKGEMFIVSLVLSGILVACANPANVAMAQELMPEGASTASSLMMGAGWGIAAIIAMFFGMIADLFGGNVVPAMLIAAFLPGIATIFTISLPKK